MARDKSDEPTFGEVGSLIGYARLTTPLNLTGGGNEPGIYDHLSTSTAPMRDRLVVESIRLVPSGILVTRAKGRPFHIPWAMVNHTMPPQEEPAKAAPVAKVA